jgi:hypothetical protein
MGGVKGEIWERFGRDPGHLSPTPTPLYKGFPKILGRDDRFLSNNYKKQSKYGRKEIDIQ